MDHLQSFITDCDRRTEIAKKRLAETQEEISAEVAAKVRSILFTNKLRGLATRWDGNERSNIAIFMYGQQITGIK